MTSNVNIQYTTEDGVELKFILFCNTGWVKGDGVIITPDMDISHPDFLDALAWAQEIFPYVRAEEYILEFGEMALYKEYTLPQEDIDLVLEAVESGVIEVSERAIYIINEIAAKRWRRREYEKAPKRTNAKGFVYLLRSNTGFYKIGRTKDPKNRGKTFGVALPFEVEFVCVIETADMIALETELHQKFAEKRGDGEWFSLVSSDVEYIKGLAT